MKNLELFAKNPLEWKILNEGVTSNNSYDEPTLKYELSTFVCEGEYQEGLSRILDGYLGNLGGTQKAVWVSGFYGSGKSHLVKVLRYLWADKPFADGTTPRLLANLPDDIKEKLKELSNKAKQYKAPLVSAGGTLKAGVGSVRLRLLGIVFNSLGIPEDISAARMYLDLRRDNKLDTVINALKSAGKDPVVEFDKIYSPAFTKAYVEAHPDAGGLDSIKKSIRDQYPPSTNDVSIEEMTKILRQALAVDPKKLPLTVIVLDEVQQFINNDASISNDVQEAVEACCQKLDGKVLFVGTGQSALNETPALQRLMGRFTIKVPLKDTDVQTVIRTVVLQKKDDKKQPLKKELDSRSGEITRQLKGTRLATQTEDNEAYVPDYPLLPVRRRFWERVLHHVDTTGTTAQMRTQLRVIHEACRAVAELPVGMVIPGDFLYDQLAPDLIMSGEIQKRFSEIIEEQKKKPDGKLRSRVCALVYLINKLPRQAEIDDGVRANVDHLSDLLCDDLKTGVSELKQKLPALLKVLDKEDGVLMEVDGEYRLQTTEGASWEAEFRRRRKSALENEPMLANERNQLLLARIQSDLSGITIPHGKGKVARKVAFHIGSSAPAKQEGLVVWVRDGYSEPESAVIKDIQARSKDDATIHVFVPKAGDWRNPLADQMAARETIGFKGNPTGTEGQEAKRSIETRQSHAEAQVKELARSTFAGARVYLSGGTEVHGDSPKEAVTDAGNKVVDRLYPRFHEADHQSWQLVITKAKQGNATALEQVGYRGDAHKHPVALEILKRVGGGVKGSELIDALEAPPYGWSKDTVAGVIITLVVTGHLKAQLLSKEILHDDLDHKKLAQCTLYLQHPVLTAMQMLKVKGLFTKMAFSVPPTQEATQAPILVNKLKELADSAGGEPPAPEAPRPPLLVELSVLSGNDLLFMLFENHDSLTKQIEQWQKTTNKLKPRLAAYEETRQLLGHASHLPEAKVLEAKLDAMVSARSLLDEPDPVAPILQDLKKLLQKALKLVQDEHAEAYQVHLQKLESHALWMALPSDKRANLLASQGVSKPVPIDPQANLLVTLSAANLDARITKVAALPSQFLKALDLAMKEAEPKASKVHLQPATLKTEEDVAEWLEQTKKALLEGLAKGPVIVG